MQNDTKDKGEALIKIKWDDVIKKQEELIMLTLERLIQ
jgi:hypothetical protein